MKNRIGNQIGSTLLEATLAISLLAIGLTGGIFLMQNATRTSVNSDFSVTASEYANEKLEQILADKALHVDGTGANDGYSYIDTFNGTSETVEFGDDGTTAEGIENFFTRQVTITEVSATDLSTPEAGSGLKKVDVTMSWTNVGATGAGSLKVSTLMAEY